MTRLERMPWIRWQREREGGGGDREGDKTGNNRGYSSLSPYNRIPSLFYSQRQEYYCISQIQDMKYEGRILYERWAIFQIRGSYMFYIIFERYIYI